MSARTYFEEYEFRAWEKCLLVVAGLLFSCSFGLYVTDYPLRSYLFNIEDEGIHRPVGFVSLKNGMLRRQIQGESEFKGIDLKETLFDEDTLVTGPDAGAVLQLDDGSSIELAASTMVRLRFESGLTLGGISRATNVDVVAGKVKSKVKTARTVVRDQPRSVPVEPVRVAAVPAPVPAEIPSPLPPPAPVPLPITGLELVAPRAGIALGLEPGARVLQRNVTLSWKAQPAVDPERKLTVRIVSVDRAVSGPGRRREVFRQQVAAPQAVGELQWTASAPGYYEWDLLGAQGEPVPGVKTAPAAFRVKPEFDAIELLEPLVAGQPLVSNQLTGRQLKDFDITLRWKPYHPDAKYRISVKSASDARSPALEREVSVPKYTFNKDRVYAGRITYQVSAPLPGGWVAKSPSSQFTFSFIAPSPVMPPNHSAITHAQLAADGDLVIFTWQKTNFTELYELEIAQDPGFKRIVEKRKLKENFYFLKHPARGEKYYWRVRGLTQQVSSPMSETFDVQVL